MGAGRRGVIRNTADSTAGGSSPSSAGGERWFAKTDDGQTYGPVTRQELDEWAAEGRLTAVRARMVGDSGAYASVGMKVLERAAGHACGPYKVPNVRITVGSILTNTTPACAFRGFGTPQVNWAVESNIDAAARALGIDRAQIRLHNLATRGEEVVVNDTPADAHRLADLLRPIRAKINLIPFNAHAGCRYQ